jgi:exonuclease SbcC
MIPIKLKISGFLSYRDPVEVDFTSFELACISGHNGAGKSSLLDAITWALFGVARKTDENLVNSGTAVQRDGAAEVVFTFEYEGSTFQIQRILFAPKTEIDAKTNKVTVTKKPSILEFRILGNNREWQPFTEKSIRATQDRIEKILHLDYDTFINASFFLQGKADQFTSTTSSERKRILSSILGLEAWEVYKERTAERRKTIEDELKMVDGRLAEINDELAQAEPRKTRLKELESQLKQLESTRKTQEKLLETARRMEASLTEQRKLVDTLGSSLDRLHANQTALQTRLAARETERHSRTDLLERSPAIEAAYAAWNASRAELESLETLAGRFREQEKRRQPFLDAINAEKARLEQELASLSHQLSVNSDKEKGIGDVEKQLTAAENSLAAAEANVRKIEELRIRLDEIRGLMAARKAENEALKVAMQPIDKRIKDLEIAAGATCPLCGQTLTAEHRAVTIQQLRAEGTQLGDAWRDNKFQIEAAEVEIREAEAELKKMLQADTERTKLVALVSQLTEKRNTLQAELKKWEETGQPRMVELKTTLESNTFSPESRAALAALDAELLALGYDSSAHEALRAAEASARSIETEYRELQSAKAALAPLDDEINNLKSQIKNLQSEVDTAEDSYAYAAAALTAAESQIPDLNAAEDEFLRMQENENKLNQEVGMARQLVSVLTSRARQKVEQEAAREALALEISRHKQLEKAFGKDGVPALLIEQAIPQIEEKANELLDRLSNGSMSVRFVTQASYKDKKREDLKETLDIVISDPAGTREYEMFSGGEAFRVNFAIRLALSEILARRTGARLQTLVIDEGFGSQDAQGRQRLIEAINTVSKDFAKILIITHLDELKEAFPNRIEVEKTPTGSSVRVI